MSAQPLNFRQANNIRRLALKGLLGVLNQTGLFDEIIHGQGGGKSGSSRSGQHVVGSCHIIPHRLGGIVAHKYSAGVADFPYHLKGVLYLKFKVFRGDAVGQIDGRTHIADNDDGPIPGQRCFGNCRARQICKLCFDLSDSCLGQLFSGLTEAP